MNFERLRWGEWLAAIAGLNLVLVTFRAWYKLSEGDGRVTAWDALENGRFLLIATAVVALLVLILVAAEQTSQLSFPPGVLAAVVGFACTVYVAYRMASPPADTLDPDIGLIFGLLSALLVTIGGLLSARDAQAGLPAYTEPATAGAATPTTEPAGGLTPDSSPGTWSPAAPQPAATGWSPAAPAPVPPATTAGAEQAGGGVRAGDEVTLTTGGARFPAGTNARVVETFSGGALVEVTAPDGVSERFELPDTAFEPATGGSGGWSPSMPEPAGQSADWGFDEAAAASAGAGAGATGAALAGEAAAAPAEKKVPFWKREIGGGKKKKDEAAGDTTTAETSVVDSPVETEERPGFFKRLFGGGRKEESQGEWAETTAAMNGDAGPADETSGWGTAGQTDTAVAEPIAAEPEAEPIAAEPEAEPIAPDPDTIAPDPEPEPEPIAAAPEPTASEPEVVPEPTPAASEPEVAPSEPDVAASEPEAPPASEPESPASSAPEPESPPAADPEPVMAASDPEPEAAATDPDAPDASAAAAGAAAASGDAEDKPTPRKRSSGRRKVPKAAVEAAQGEGGPPKVGDQVQLKVGGGKYEAGTRGTVVDVFSAGVIVELSDDSGRTERLDLPFEAVGPADA